MGGTGKTPMVRWLAEWFGLRGIAVGLVSRGYGAEDDHPNDEAMELAACLPGIPHVQDRDRVRGARQAVEQSACDVLVLDDGFQHRRLRRDLDIVLIDALQPFGFSHVFPRGTLREPLSGLNRADVVVLTRSDLIAPLQRTQIRDRVQRLAPSAAWVETCHQPLGLLASDGTRASLATLAGQPLAAFCGVGNPDGFRRTLEQCRLDVSRFRAYPDHYSFSSEDRDQLAAWAASEPAISAAICTHKDLVKVRQRQLGDIPLWALMIGVQVTQGGEELDCKLLGFLGQDFAGPQADGGSRAGEAWGDQV